MSKPDVCRASNGVNGRNMGWGNLVPDDYLMQMTYGHGHHTLRRVRSPSGDKDYVVLLL